MGHEIGLIRPSPPLLTHFYLDILTFSSDICSCRVPEFEATKYLVTNQEFHEFVRDGGYQRRELWTEEGVSSRHMLGFKQLVRSMMMLYICQIPISIFGVGYETKNYTLLALSIVFF